MADMELLDAISDKWMSIARRALADADFERDPMGKRLIEHGARCYFNCANELKHALDAGNTSANLSLQEFTKDPERP